MEYYDVPAYTPEQRLIDIHLDDAQRDISMNIETCMEELAMSWGLNWHRIEGLALPQRVHNGLPGRPPNPTAYPPSNRAGTM